MDVISSHQAGVREAVATSGTAMTEQHLKILSRLTPDVRLAYDGDAAGVKAAERAIMLAGDLGVNLSVVTDYHGAKDPDELIQKDPELWRKAVQNCRPAVEWLLDKYQEDLDLTSGLGKREYSDVAMKLLKNVSDPVERKHYEQLVARRLDCSVEDLLAKKMTEASPKTLKKVAQSGAAKSEEAQFAARVAAIRDNLLAIVVYGGITGVKGVEPPEDEVKLGELEMVFETRYQGWEQTTLEREAKDLLARYKTELNKQESWRLTQELEAAERAGDEEKVAGILRKITELKKNAA